MKLISAQQTLNISGGSSYSFETSLYGFCGAWIGSIGAVVAIHSLSAPYNNPLLKVAGFLAGGTLGRTVGHVFGAGLYHINQKVVSGVDSYFKPEEDALENTTI